jgi:hypothetical protein
MSIKIRTVVNNNISWWNTVVSYTTKPAYVVGFSNQFRDVAFIGIQEVWVILCQRAVEHRWLMDEKLRADHFSYFHNAEIP